MSYPTCLLTLQKCLFYSELPQTTLNKAINDLRKRLNARVLTRFGHFAHIMWTRLSRLIWHYFVKVGDNCIKICNLAYIRTYNGCVENRLKILNRLWKKWKNSDNLRGDFLTHTVDLTKRWRYSDMVARRWPMSTIQHSNVSRTRPKQFRLLRV